MAIRAVGIGNGHFNRKHFKHYKIKNSTWIEEWTFVGWLVTVMVTMMTTAATCAAFPVSHKTNGVSPPCGAQMANRYVARLKLTTLLTDKNKLF